MKILDPKAPAINYIQDMNEPRYVAVKNMIKKYGIKQPVLVFGEPAPFESKLSQEYGIPFFYTNFDLNYKFSDLYITNIKTMFCCELIEHLLNPLWFFRQARVLMTDETLMYLTYPLQPHAFWCDCHFHEYDKSRFLYLLRESGLEVVDYKEYINWKAIKGIRPIIRNTPLGWLKQQIYVLKKGKLQ